MILKICKILFCYLLVLLTISIIPLDKQGIVYIIGLIYIGQIYYKLLELVFKSKGVKNNG